MAKKKILILRFSSIGDIVLTTPVIRCLKNQVKSAEIHYCTKIRYKPLVENNPYIDRNFYLKDDIWALIRLLKREKYDYIVDLHNNIRTLTIKSALFTKNLSLNKLNYKKWLYVNFKIDRMPDLHIVDRYLNTLSALGVTNDGKGLDYFIPAKDDLRVQRQLPMPKNAYVAFALGGQHATKRLPTHKIVELCQRIDLPLVFLGDQYDAPVAEEVIQQLEQTQRGGEEDVLEGNVAVQVAPKMKLKNACGKYTINQSASIVRDAKFVISHDTGLMHIAAAFRKKIFSIWGSTTPSLGMYPYKTNFVSIENQDLKCRPCSKIGYNECPHKHFSCMNDLSFDAYFPKP